jgi:polar amino acid transport system substrate-binding protein
MIKPFGLAVLFGGLLASVATGARADVITIRADEWCPYNCAPDSDKPGYGIEIAKEVFTKAGHTIDYKNMAWARALEECAKGSVVAVIGTTKRESPNLVFPNEHIAVSDNTFVVKKGSAWKYAGPASLEKVKLGAIQGYGYDGEVGAYIEANAKDSKKIDMVGTDTALEMNLKKLVAGRIDATVDAKPVLEYKLGQMGLADKTELVGSVDSSLNYIAFAPNHPKAKEYSAILDKGIAEMRASGRLKAILDRYKVSDWK